MCLALSHAYREWILHVNILNKKLARSIEQCCFIRSKRATCVSMMNTSVKRTPLKTPQGTKSLRQKFVRSLKGKSQSVEQCSVEPMKVYLRVRPFSEAELSSGENQGCLEFEAARSVLMCPPKESATSKCESRNRTKSVHRFSFSYVFKDDTSQKMFFQKTTLNVVKDFVQGQHCLVFSYGVTNAGKTYTIHGSPQRPGILPRTFNVLFNNFRGKIHDQTNLKPKMFCDVMNLGNALERKEDIKRNAVLNLSTICQSSQTDITTMLFDEDSTQDVFEDDLGIETSGKYALWISFTEIYNEQIFDLLEPIEAGKKRTVLKQGEDKNGNPYVKGLRHVLVVNAEEANKVLKVGQQNLRYASTKLNKNSSRSHCIFSLKLARVETAGKEQRVVQVSQLSFVDLAGSERYTKTHSSDERLKEAGNINTSIMTLGKCIESLRYNQKHPSNPRNIPFRESKLTRLLQVYFCGQGNVSMIVNINQCASTFDETLHALKFSAIARKVATVNFQPQSCSEELATDSESLLAVIKTLQSKLVDEAMKNSLMELKIREEVSQEVSEQMAEMEENYSERLKEEENMNEEVCEKRMEILANSVRKSMRRQRPSLPKSLFDQTVEPDEDSRMLPYVQLQREQIKVKEQQQLIHCLKDTIENQKKVIEELRQGTAVVPRKLTFVSVNSSETSLEICEDHNADDDDDNDESDNDDDVFQFATSTSTPPRSAGQKLLTGSSKSHKSKIFGKLEGSLSRSAKKWKKKVFTDSPSNISLSGNRTRAKLNGKQF